MEAGRAEPKPASLNPKYTFDQFVIADSNRFAHAAALAVAEMPAQAYTPLFLYGRSGVGKTHLLQAIGNYVRQYELGLEVRYATVEEFTTEFVQAIRGQNTKAFKERFRAADVLLIDDVQFLEQRTRTREEFFHTFNALYERGSQLVISSDCPPSDLTELEARLRERFQCGLVAEIKSPDLAARVAMLRSRARQDGLGAVDEQTLKAIAHYVANSVRALEGALIRVIAYASLTDQALTPELVQLVLEREYPRAGRSANTTIEDIQAATAESFGLTRETLLAYDRRPTPALARHVAMYLARELTEEALPALGKAFGDRKHTTVLHAHRRIAGELHRDTLIHDTVESLRHRLSRAR